MFVFGALSEFENSTEEGSNKTEETVKSKIVEKVKEIAEVKKTTKSQQEVN